MLYFERLEELEIFKIVTWQSARNPGHSPSLVKSQMIIIFTLNIHKKLIYHEKHLICKQIDSCSGLKQF